MEVPGCEGDMTPHYSGLCVCVFVYVCVCVCECEFVCVCSFWDRGQGVQGCQMSHEFKRNTRTHPRTPSPTCLFTY